MAPDATLVHPSAVGRLAMPGDDVRLAVLGFLARYVGGTREGYAIDLRQWLAFCDEHNLHAINDVRRPHLELFIRHLESLGYAQATIARRFGTIATFYRVLEDDDAIRKSPARGVRRPEVDIDAQHRTWLTVLEVAAVVREATRQGGVPAGLIGLLLQMGLRVSEACGLDVSSVREENGWDVLTWIRKGHKTTRKAIPVPVMRAIRPLLDGRPAGAPILTNRDGRRLDRKSAARMVTRIAQAAGVEHPITPHGLRRSAATFARDMGMQTDQIQEMLNHANPRTTMIYLRTMTLDRQSAHQVAAAMAGMAT